MSIQSIDIAPFLQTAHGFSPTCAVCIVQGFLCPSDCLQGNGLAAHHLGAQGLGHVTSHGTGGVLPVVLPVEKDENPEIPGFSWLFFEDVICGPSIEWWTGEFDTLCWGRKNMMNSHEPSICCLWEKLANRNGMLANKYIRNIVDMSHKNGLTGHTDRWTWRKRSFW